MDMNKILKNFDDASTGNKTVASAETGSMKAILENFNQVAEGSYPMPSPAAMPQEDRGQPVSMNVSVNASGKENVQDLLNLMKTAGLGDAQPVDRDMMPMQTDMQKLRDIVDGPSCADEEIEEEEWTNSPDEEYKDDNYMTQDLSGGINRKKKSYSAAQDGDNAMAVENSIKEKLMQALEEKKKGGKDGKACWDGYYLAGTKMKGGKEVDDCRPRKKPKK